jgi:cell wall-associated NlpC family hydrolase
VDARQIQPGDLLFFATESNGASHVGIAIEAAALPDARSGRAFIHAPGVNGAVRIEMLETNYWRSRFLGARRLF